MPPASSAAISRCKLITPSSPGSSGPGKRVTAMTTIWAPASPTIAISPRSASPTNSIASGRSGPSCARIGRRLPRQASLTPVLPYFSGCAPNANFVRGGPSPWAIPERSKKEALAAVEFRQDFLDLVAKTRRDVGPRQRVGDGSGEKSDLRAAVEAATGEFQTVEGLRPRQLNHGVGELNFTPGAAVLLLQKIEDLRLQNITAGQD